MKKYIVLSVNENQDYLYYMPITCWSWAKLGWTPVVFFEGRFSDDLDEDEPNLNAYVNELFDLSNSGPFNGIILRINKDEVPGYRSDTITQISRLYASRFNSFKPDDLLMTGDIDMLALSNYWNPNPSGVTVYGHDLTGFTHHPICYISMSAAKWENVMKFDRMLDAHQSIKRDLDTLPQAKDPDFYKYWFSDQDLITQRLKEYGTDNIDFINRGQYSNGYAKGRVDRGSWTLEHDQFIDCHMHRDLFKAFYPDPNPAHVVKWQQTMDMLNKCFPGEDFSWFLKYTQEYAKLAYGK